jgi:nucleotidyltransferase-like protein
MMELTRSSTAQQDFLDRIVSRVIKVSKVQAISFGGSRAFGTATPESDYDFNIYYDEPFDVESLRAAVAKICDPESANGFTAVERSTPWCGFGWFKSGGHTVDLLYRDLAYIGDIIADCRQGRIDCQYRSGHPHAFISAKYMGEIAYSQPLWDPFGKFEKLRRLTTPYPDLLRRSIIERFLPDAKMALGQAGRGRAKADQTYVIGCAYRCAACLCQVLSALNGVYLLSEKGGVDAVSRLPHCPPAFKLRVSEALGGIAAGRILYGLGELRCLSEETEQLVQLHSGSL